MAGVGVVFMAALLSQGLRANAQHIPATAPQHTAAGCMVQAVAPSLARQRLGLARILGLRAPLAAAGILGVAHHHPQAH